MIPKQVIDEILGRTDISQLISKYVTLQRAGTNMKGLCPFHSEKTPSFTVFPKDNSFYCFGCGVGGDAITFVRKTENLDYVAAVEHLAKAVGITIPEQPDEQGYLPKFDRRRLYDMNRTAARYFHTCLKANTPGAKAAYEYLHVNRGLSDATITHFGLGYAPQGFGEFTTYMKQSGFTEEELIAGNLCGKDQKTGRLYTTFYHRVMFPIIDVAGNVIAFGGRVMDGSMPKYKNSSDTPIYNKRRNVYALNYAKDACSEQIILCEGYMDVIAMHVAGFTNAVATLGTAITPEHARLMKRYTQRVIISYDMDEAGQNAATKAMRLLEDVGLEVRILKMEWAKDPDEFIRKYGKEKFRSVIEGSKTKFDYNMNRILSKYVLSVPQDKINAAGELCEMIADVYSAAERDVYIRTAAKVLDMSQDAVRRDVERLSRKKQSREKQKTVQDLRQKSLGFSDRINPDYVKMPAVARHEEAVLGLMMMYPEHLASVKNGKVMLSTEDFLTELNRRVFQSLMNLEEGESIPDQSQFTPDEFGRITRMRISRMELTDNGNSVFLECVNNLKNSVEKSKQIPSVSSVDDLESFLDSLRNKN